MEKKPVLLVTRPAESAAEFAKAAEARFPQIFEIVHAPLLTIVPEPADLDLDGVQALLFTSANGVRQFASRWTRRDIPCLCVGDRTAQVAAEAGLQASSAAGDASALAELAALSYLEGAGRMLHLRGAETVGDLAATLAAEGIPAEEEILYDQRPASLSPQVRVLFRHRAIVAPLFSPRSAALFRIETEGLPLQSTAVIALSKAVAGELDPGRYGAFSIAARPDASAVLDGIAALME